VERDRRRDRAPSLVDSLATRLEADGLPVGRGVLDSSFSVLTVEEAKGLEFDAVVVVEPSAWPLSAAGAAGLYVALTRATRRWLSCTSSPAPSMLGGSDRRR